MPLPRLCQKKNKPVLLQSKKPEKLDRGSTLGLWLEQRISGKFNREFSARYSDWYNEEVVFCVWEIDRTLPSGEMAESGM